MFNFIFITGAGRCGTNVMKGLIDGHSDIKTIPNELKDFLGVVLQYNGLSSCVNLALSGKEILHLIASTYRQEKDYIQIKKRLVKRFHHIENNGAKSISINDFLTLAYESILFKKSGTIVINLQNENISGLLESFPGCKVIHMLRNPLTQLNSRYLLRFSTPRNYNNWEFGDNFFRNYNSFRQAYYFRNHVQVMVVRMEELQRNHKSVMEGVFEFIDMEIQSINFKLTNSGKMTFQNTRRGVKGRSKEIFSDQEDWSCLSPNDLYYCSKMEVARYYYDIPKFPYANNSYIFFLARHLGLVGKNRKKIRHPYKIFKLIIHSISLYFQDLRAKVIFENFI